MVKMISKWKKEMSVYGYEYKSVGSAGGFFVKHIGSIRHHIWEDHIPNRGFVVNTFISIKDPFCVNSSFEYVVVIPGRLTTHGIVMDEGGGFFTKDATEEVFDLLIKYAFPWYEDKSTIEELIKYVDADVVRHESDNMKFTISSVIKKHFFSKTSKEINEDKVRIKPISKLKLSLLHYHEGNFDLACEYARQWLRHVRNMPGEPERTIRQLKEMGCKE